MFKVGILGLQYNRSSVYTPKQLFRVLGFSTEAVDKNMRPGLVSALNTLGLCFYSCAGILIFVPDYSPACLSHSQRMATSKFPSHMASLSGNQPHSEVVCGETALPLSVCRADLFFDLAGAPFSLVDCLAFLQLIKLILCQFHT